MDEMTRGLTYHFGLQLVLQLLEVGNTLHIEVMLLLGLIELILHLALGLLEVQAGLLLLRKSRSEVLDLDLSFLACNRDRVEQFGLFRWMSVSKMVFSDKAREKKGRRKYLHRSPSRLATLRSWLAACCLRSALSSCNLATFAFSAFSASWSCAILCSASLSWRSSSALAAFSAASCELRALI